MEHTQPVVTEPRRLHRGHTLAVAQPLGQMVVCTGGTLAVTLDPAAQHGAVDYGGRLLVHALSDAMVSVVSVPCH